jgi:hypothetical protein
VFILLWILRSKIGSKIRFQGCWDVNTKAGASRRSYYKGIDSLKAEEKQEAKQEAKHEEKRKEEK